MAEKFLILGCNSFYGKNFTDLLRRNGEDFDLVSRHRLNLDTPHGQKTVYRHWESLRETLDNFKPDYVVNFMSRSMVAESWAHIFDYCMVNSASTSHLFQVLKEHSVKKLIHISTPEVYGSVDAWVKEDQPFNPSTPYAVSRAAGDMMLKVFHKAYNFPMCITRTSNIYGPGQPAYRIVPAAIRCKKNGASLKLDGSGTSVRNFIHVKDACEAAYLVAKRGRVGETYHISGDVALSIRELVEKIGCEWDPSPERLGKDYAYKLDSTKIRKELGWRDTISLEEGLRQCESATLV